MPLYHLIDTETNLVVYADKAEATGLDNVKSTNPGYTIIASQTEGPDSPRVFPGFLFHEGEFWAPVRRAKEVTSGKAMPVLKEDFFRLFTFEELGEIYDFENNPEMGKKEKKALRVFLRIVESSSHINLSSPIITRGLALITKNNMISESRNIEILSSTFRQ